MSNDIINLDFTKVFVNVYMTVLGIHSITTIGLWIYFQFFTPNHLEAEGIQSIALHSLFTSILTLLVVGFFMSFALDYTVDSLLRYTVLTVALLAIGLTTILYIEGTAATKDYHYLKDGKITIEEGFISSYSTELKNSGDEKVRTINFEGEVYQVVNFFEKEEMEELINLKKLRIYYLPNTKYLIQIEFLDLEGNIVEKRKQLNKKRLNVQ